MMSPPDDDDTLFDHMVRITRQTGAPLPRSVRVLGPMSATKMGYALRRLEDWCLEHRDVIEAFARYLTHMPHLVVKDEDLSLWVIECEYLREQATREGIELP